MTDLDQGGRGFQRTRVYLGPSLGWVDEQVQPTVDITTPGTYNVKPGDSLILVEVAGFVTINLPDVRQWIQQPATQPATGFDRSITIKDLGGNATNFGIIVNPFGQQYIDNIQQAVVINVARTTLKLIPLIDMTGWAVETSIASGGGGGGSGGDVFKAGNNTFTGVNVFQNQITAPTMGIGDSSQNVATTQYVKSQNYLTGVSLLPYATLFDPVFTGDPRAPTPLPGDNDTSIATTGFVQQALAGFTGGAPAGAEYITAGTNPTLTNEMVLTDSGSITWDKSVPGIIKGNTVAGGGNVSNVGTPVAGQLAVWTTATTIQGIDPSSSGFAPINAPLFTGDPRAPTPPLADSDTTIATTEFVKGNLVNYQPLDNDLSALSALTGTNTIYYRSGPDAWSPVGFSGISFSGGVLTVTASSPPDAEYITSSSNPTLTNERVLIDTPTITWDFSTPGQAKASAAVTTVPHHGFSAVKNVDQVVVTDTWTRVNYNQAVYNNGNLYDTVNSRYIPVAGEVSFIASVQCNGLLPGSNLYLAIYKSGAILKFETANNTNGNAHISCFDFTDGTAYYEVWVFGYTGGPNFTISTGNNDATYFQGMQPMGPPGPAGGLGVAGTPSAGQYAVFVSPSAVQGVDLPSPFTTGDVKLTFKAIADTGWIMVDDGSIGNAASFATTRANADTQALFLLFWNSIPSLVIQDSGGSTVTRGANALTDYNNARRLVIPKMLGRGLAVAGAGAGLTNRGLGTADGNEKHTMTSGEMFKHSHSITDVAHGHGVSDPTHLHPLINQDAMITGIVMDVSAIGGGAGYSATPANTTTNAAYTNISIIASGTGITGTNQTGNTDPFDIMNPRSYLNVMVKL